MLCPFSAVYEVHADAALNAIFSDTHDLNFFNVLAHIVVWACENVVVDPDVYRQYQIVYVLLNSR